MENLLSSLAYLDAVHDFKQLAHNHRSTIEESLPGKTIVPLRDEDDALELASTYAEDIERLEIDDPNAMFRQLGGNESTPIAIVCDASFCSAIITKLKLTTAGNVYFIINRETILDPGNNMSHTDSGNFYVAKDIDPDEIEYPKYIKPENNSIHPFHELHSKFDISIKNENQIFKMTTYLNNRIIEQNVQYRNNTVDNTIDKINSTTNKDLINSCFLRKRSGDWLQVLSCFDKHRKYLINGQVKNLTECIVYFCSADRTALSFALCIGVNCLLKRIDGYFMYKSKEIMVPNGTKLSSDELFQYYRDEKLDEVRALLTEGLDEYYKLKNEWESVLNTVDRSDSLDDLKTKLILAYHYASLSDFGSKALIIIIEQFLRNPHDPIFSHEIEGYSARKSVVNRCKQYPSVIRRFRHLNPYMVSVNEEYYNLFRFENISFESPDMIYGCTLFDNLIRMSGNDLFITNFVIKIMERIIELTSHNEIIVALYTLFMDANNLTFQGGGGYTKYSSKSISRDLLIKIGDYLTKFMLAKNRIHTFNVADDYPISIEMTIIGEKINEYLIYKKHIIPKDYLQYVMEANEEFEDEGELGPYHALKEFLKRQRRPRNRNARTLNNCKKYSKRIYKQKNRPMIQTRRRR